MTDLSGSKPNLPFVSIFKVTLICLALAACGGGGGGGGSDSTPPANTGGGSGGGGSGGGGSGGGTPPTTPPTPVGQEALEAASHFLNQASFGPSFTEIEDLAYGSASLWFRDQLSLPPTLHLDALYASGVRNDFESFRGASDSFWGAIISGDDQLRQRMVYALSQILVISEGRESQLAGLPLTTAQYMDVLTEHAFGNYRDLLEEVTYSPAMAVYLTYLYNRREDPATGRVPDENYARELMQLFTIGLVELRPDGSVITDNQGRPVETYDNMDVTGLARVFTGLGLDGPNFWWPEDFDPASYSRLITFDQQHSPSEKRFLNTVIPAGTGAEASIDAALDTIFAHPNLGPFLGRQLIQRFTTSHPSPAYINRVSNVFDSGRYVLPDGEAVGTGQRGDLAATLAAILFDPEARRPAGETGNSYGKVREPVLRFTHWARAFNIDGTQAWREDFLWDTSSSGSLSQHPFRSRSVFNFYRPGYVAPGTATGAAGLTAPELQIVNEASVIGFTNFLSAFVTDSTWGENRTETLGFHADYAAAMAIADDVDALIDRLDLIFTFGGLTETTRDRMRQLLEAIEITPDEEEERRRGRVQAGVLMIMTSPEYTVLR